MHEFRFGIGVGDPADCHGASLACAFRWKYKNSCIQCQASRTKYLKVRSSTGVISFDLSGPHIKAKDEVAYFLVPALANKEKATTPYARAQKSQKATERLQGIKSILSQIRAEVDDPHVVVRVHTDGGGEFTATKIVHDLQQEGLWKTHSAAHEPEASGKAERQVQAIKEAATSLLLHADMPRSFWSYAVKQAAYELRSHALGIERPVGTPAFGDVVGVRIQGAEPFAACIREGVYLCVEESAQDASQVLIDGPQGLCFVTTRLPTPFATEPKRWHKMLSPDETVAVWVANDGSVRWTEPALDDVITVEEPGWT